MEDKDCNTASPAYPLKSGNYFYAPLDGSSLKPGAKLISSDGRLGRFCGIACAHGSGEWNRNGLCVIQPDGESDGQRPVYHVYPFDGKGVPGYITWYRIVPAPVKKKVPLNQSHFTSNTWIRKCGCNEASAKRVIYTNEHAVHTRYFCISYEELMDRWEYRETAYGAWIPCYAEV